MAKINKTKLTILCVCEDREELKLSYTVVENAMVQILWEKFGSFLVRKYKGALGDVHGWLI